MSEYIEIIGSESRQSSKLRSAIDNTRRVVDEVDRLKDTFDQIASGADWAALSVALGGTVDIAEAEIIYNLLAAAKVALDDADIANFTNRLG